MRPGQQNKRGRGRGNNNNGGGGGGGNNNNNNFNRKGGNPLTRTYDSSGPDVKIRGTAQHIAEKYAQLGRDAQSSGDRVIAENYLQHAEHYNRIIAAAQAQMQERFQRDERNEFGEGVEREGDDVDANDGDNDDVVVVQPPRQQQAPQQPRRSDEQQQRRSEEQPRRNDDRPQRQRRQEEQPAPVAAAEAPQPEVIDGTGPQPEIEGIPAEVSMDEESAAAQPRERQPRRRSATPRPRRPRRGADGEASGEATEGEAPAMADATSE